MPEEDHDIAILPPAHPVIFTDRRFRADAFYTHDETAALLRLDRRAFDAWRCERSVRPQQIGKGTYFLGGDVIRALLGRETAA